MYACAEVNSGKEAPMVTLVMLFTLWAVKAARPAILPWCANALFLLRPEGIFACLIILVTALKTQGRAALKSFILPCGITLAWYGFLFFYFGTIMPHGMIAKHKVLLAADPVSELIRHSCVIGSMVTNSSLGFLLPGTGMGPFMVCSVLVFVYFYRRIKEPCWVLYRNIAVVQLIFIVIAHVQTFSWYYCWLALLGPTVMAQLSADAWPAPKEGQPSGSNLPRMLGQAAFCLLMFFYLRTGFSFIPFNWVPYLERGVIYRESALFLMDKTRGEETIAASDVGIIGYYYSGPILDLMGLVNNETLKYYPIKNNTNYRFGYQIPPEAISALKPKYLMAPIGHCQKFLLNDPDFQRNYTEIKRWTNPDMSDRVVLVWMRNAAIGQPAEK
jgi:hypothetical protein